MSARTQYDPVAANATAQYGSTFLNGPIIDVSGTSHELLIPETGIEYGWGDSNVVGTNSANQPYVSGGVTLAPVRWLNQLGSRRNRSLTITNLGRDASKISWNGGVDYSHFNMTSISNLPFQWNGLGAFLCGWNNIDAGTTTDAFFTVMQRAHEAMIAKALIDDYAGMSFIGWSRTNTSGAQYSWVTTGNNDQFATTDDNLKPFDDAGATLAARYRTALTASQTIQFTITDKRAIALFFETDSSGGDFNVDVNGVFVGTFSNDYNNIGGNDVGAYPYVVWLENVPSSSTVKITNVSGTQYFLAFGWVESTGSYVQRRQLIYGSTIGNNANGRADSTLWRNAMAAQSACGAFSRYPVFFANCISKWNESTDQEPTDISHLTAIGNDHVFQAFDAAIPVAAQYSPNFIDLSSRFGNSSSGGTVLPVGSAVRTGAYSVTTSDSTVRCNSTSGAFTVTLPTPVGATGRIYTVKRVDTSANAVSVATAAGLIDGAATFSLSGTARPSVTVQSDGANWMII